MDDADFCFFSSLPSSFSLFGLVSDGRLRSSTYCGYGCIEGLPSRHIRPVPLALILSPLPKISGPTYSGAKKVSAKHVLSDFRLLRLFFSPSLMGKPIFLLRGFAFNTNLTHLPSSGLSKQGRLVVKFGSITVVDDGVPLIMPERRVSVEPLCRNACTGITIHGLQTFWLRPRQTISSAQSGQVRRLGHTPDGIGVVYYRKLALDPLSSASIMIYP